MTKLYLFILFGLNFIININGQNNVNFFHLSPKTENEPIVLINTVQDHLGYIWMSHDKGIIKYDGYEYWFYSMESIFDKSEIKDSVERIEIDEYGNLLILSVNGLLARREVNGNFTQLNQLFSRLNKYVMVNSILSNKNQIWLADYSGTIYLENKITSKFDSITTIPNIKFNKTQIIDLQVTKNNTLIISTDIGVLYKYSVDKDLLQEINGPFNNYPGILKIVLGVNDDIWIGTENNGLFHYDLTKNKYIQHSYYKANIDLLAKDLIISLYCDSQGIIWAGSDGEGLYRIDPITGDIQLFKYDYFDKSSLRSNSIIDINEDSNNNLWVITNYGDINILPNNENHIYYHKGSTKNITARVLSILKDSKNIIWIGTDGNGLAKINTFTGKENQYLTAENSIDGFYIQSLIEDENNNIWIGTYKNGLWFYDRKLDEFSKITISNSHGILATDVLSIFSDSKGRIWVGSDISLDIFNLKKERLVSFSYFDKGLYGEIVRSIIEDSDGHIWFGVDSAGLFKFNEAEKFENSNFQRFSYTLEDNKINDYYSIPSMVADTKNGIWLLNRKGDLFYFNTKNNTYKEYNNFEPFSDAIFKAVLMENDNSLWLSSTQGLWNFNVNDSIIKKYYKTDGFQDDFYIHRSAYKDESDLLYFGGLNGVIGFNPNNISKAQIDSKLYINTIEILNESASTLIPEQIKNEIEKISQLDLEYNQSSFSFRFSTIGNILNSNYFYAYRLKGFNDTWKVTKNERIASYTNIPSGNYIFEVKSGTKIGNWDIPVKSINIKIKPPLWKHPFTFLLYFILLAVFLYIIYVWYKLRRNLLIQKLKNNQEKEIYDAKMNFFSKMSHEIQTPLTLIIGPIESMLKNSRREGNALLNQRLKIISNNARRLSNIANEITTIRNKETGQLKLKVSRKDIIKNINEIFDSFLERARFKKIDFERNNFDESYELWYDSELIEHIIYNLLSNAFKFTPSEGKIILETKIINEKDMFMIKIQDSGHGISKKEQAKIFELFYRSNEATNYYKGSGIGLALVKELVELHKGEITVSSELEKGTKFKVYLPLNKSKYSKEEIFSLEKTSKNDSKLSIEQPLELINIKSKKYKLLIVEDNFEMQYFLQDVFHKNYNVFLADNGVEGISIAEKEQPDIIISDISMPIMNGLEMCRNLQDNKNTSHIPIILLTAKNTTKTKLKGLKIGAIEFIHKPFDIKELQLKTHNILTLNEKALSHFASQYISIPDQTNTKPKDLVFLEKLIEILNSEISNPEFKLESLSRTLNMSYSVIYKKCLKLTGKTIVDLFRLMRLKRSAILICKSGYSISEACYKVGFNDTKYFSRCFKKQFSKNPSSFKKEASNSDLDSILSKYKLNDF
ncbi:MAG: ATP-binding protein [Bacteroidota bacterium]